MRLGWWAVAALLGLSWVAPAAADVVVIVPPYVEHAARSHEVERAVELLARALRVDGFDRVLPGQAAVAAEMAQARGEFPAAEDPLECVTSECASAYRQLFDAAFAAQISLFTDPAAQSVTVLITEKPEASFSGSQPVEGGDLAAAVRKAYDEARRRQAEGAGPFLSVAGSPEGALVYLDGAEFGRIPIQRRRVEPGAHRLEVRSDGYVTASQTLTVPARIDHAEEREVQLVPLATPSVEVGGDRPRRHWADYAVGGTMMAVGGLFCAVGVYEVISRDECMEHREDGSCSRRATVDALTGVNLGAGAAGVLLGAVTMWTGPFGYWFSAGPEQASVTLKARF